jgi:CobQ/CobB/MinD/ParA nucleotide binding domain
MAPSKSRTDSIQLLKSMVDLICSNKGGVGKSFVCRIIYHLYLLHQLPIIPFDADTSTHDFSDIYTEIPDSNILSFDPEWPVDSFTPVINAMEGNTHGTLVNMPSNIDQIFGNWFVLNEIDATNPEASYQMRIWYVITADYDAYMNLLVSLKKYGASISHVVIKNNLTRNMDWQDFNENTELQSLIKLYDCPIIEIPHLYIKPDKLNSFRLRKLKWSEILALPSEPSFGLMERDRVKNFLAYCDKQLINAGLI